MVHTPDEHSVFRTVSRRAVSSSVRWALLALCRRTEAAAKLGQVDPVVADCKCVQELIVRLNSLPQAAKYFRKALGIDPGYRPSRKELEHVEQIMQG